MTSAAASSVNGAALIDIDTTPSSSKIGAEMVAML
jgi:hypothetical protein